MNIIDKQIFSLTLEIIIIGALIFLTNILWWTFDYSKEANLAYAYSNYKNLSLSYKENSDKIDVKITNDSKLDKKYKLYLKIDKDDTINELILDNNKIDIMNITNFIIGNSKYYLLKEDSISNKTTEKKEIVTNVKNITLKIEE